MKIEFDRLITPKVMAGALAFALLFLALTFVWIQWSAPPAQDISGLQSLQTVIPRSTSTAPPAATPTFDPYAPLPTPTIKPGQFAIGSYVQISGTQGVGLRIRSEPGLKGTQLFMGFDTEAYTVLDGPRDVDGYTWYYLAAINDQKRTGWAVSDFLTLIPKP